ncbi:hypothetical protein AAFF_G00256710 [Aldrovandia affinis]|uniref:DUF4614 domain-containing protein n=1 Tax=Aldrovandia affinis TaxID=143900 RepID=A0AAD7SSW8_9TELE|nr:hypothetical protein AAFF_G00256710 [Aldrovandia affinis]
MWNRTGARSSALERAQAQLSGRRGSSQSHNGSRDDLQEYMDALTNRKSTLQVRHTYEDLSDISSDDRESEYNNGVTGTTGRIPMPESPSERLRVGEGSRFLKKVPPHAATGSQSPTLTKAGMRTEESRSVASSQRGSQSAALSRLALIEDRFRNRSQGRESRDADPPGPEDTPTSARSSGELSAKGSRFLKKSTSAIRQRIPEPDMVGGPAAPQVKFSGRGVSLDSDEEDMKRLLGGPLESSDESLLKEVRTPARESPRPAKKSFMKNSQKFTPAYSPFAGRKTPSRTKSPPSPSPPSRGSPRHSGVRAQALRSPSFSSQVPEALLSSVSAHSEVRSLDELFLDAPPSDDTISVKSDMSDEFKINIMSLDDLVPDTLGTIEEKPVEKKKEKVEERRRVEKTKPPSLGLNVVLVDDVLSEEEIRPAEAKVEYESDFESEIQTVSEISERLGQGRGGRDASTASETQNDASSGRSRKARPSSPPERRRRSGRSASYSSQSESRRSDGSRGGGSRRGSRSRSSLSDAVTPPRERRRASSTRGTVREAAVQTQTDGLSYTWSSGFAALGPSIGMCHVDPTPIASHVVSAEAVEALTAYSPAVFALNDMLRQQLALTRQIVGVSRHLHTSLLEALGPANYRYTTLEDTKEFIKRHKSPKLTVDEALEQVLQEMREYRYI